MKMLLTEARKYSVTFPIEYYDEMRRLTRMPKDTNKPHHKPAIFAVYTIKYAYGRFNLKELIKVLQERNPFLPGLNARNFKHFQLLRDEDSERLKFFISEMILTMKHSKIWSEFETKYAREYKLAFSDDLFNR